MRIYKISFIAKKGIKKRIQMKEVQAASNEDALSTLRNKAAQSGVSISNENIHTEYFCSVNGCSEYGSFSKDHGKTWSCSSHR